MSSSGASRRAGARAHLPFSRLVSALDRAVDGVPATALRDTIALATSWTVVFAAVSVLVAIVCFGRANASERGWPTSLAYALAGSVNATLAVGALAGLGYCRRGWRARMSMAGDARGGGRHEAARGVEMVKVCGNCDAPFPVQQPVAHKFRCARCGLTSRKPKQRRADSGTEAAPAEAADAPRSPKRAEEKAAADAERRAAAKAEKESRKQRLREEAREREAAEDAQRRELQTLVENARAAKEEETRLAEAAAEAAREEAAAAEKEKAAAAERAKTRAEMDKAEEETTERKQVEKNALPVKSVPAPLAREAKEKAPGEIRAGASAAGATLTRRDGRTTDSRVKTIPAPRAAPVPAPRQTAQTAQTAQTGLSGAKKPEKGGVPAPRPVPAPRVPGSAEALTSNPSNPGLSKTRSAPSMHAPQKNVPVPVPVGGTDTRSGGGGASNNSGGNTELLAVDFDPPLPPMAPMAPAPAWTGPTSLAPVAPGLGLSPGESPRAAPGPYEQRVTAHTPAADAREAFDPLGGARSWLGAGAGFMNLIQEPGARAGGTAGEPVPGQAAAAAARTVSPSLAPRHPAPPGMPPLVAPPAPPPPPGAPPPLPSGPPPPSARIAGRRYPPPPSAAPPPLPPMPHPARTQNAFGGGIFGGFSSAASLGGVAPAGGSHSFRRSASEPRHERFDSDEFSVEGRELEDELMALTGGLMHLDDDDDDDDAATPPKPEEDAAVGVTATPTAPRPSEETSLSPASAESPAPRVSEAMTRSVSKIRAAASEGRAVPTEFFCSITHDVMVDPVIAWDGYTYERVSVARWLAKHSTSPMTGAPMPDFTLRPNQSMRSQMIGFAERL